MDMLTIHSGKLRAIGYDAGKRLLRIELDNGSALEYENVGESLWRNFKSAASPWSYYRDNIEEEFSARRASPNPASTRPGKNPLDDLFR